MSSAEYREACEALGLSPTYSACPVLGISPRVAVGFSSGERTVTLTVAALLRTKLELMACRAKLERCRAEFGI